jgi:hypothetical protein
MQTPRRDDSGGEYHFKNLNALLRPDVLAGPLILREIVARSGIDPSWCGLLSGYCRGSASTNTLGA